MLLVDYRGGSGPLLGALSRAGLPVEKCALDYGDFAFSGRGDKGEPVEVGIELKKLNDVIQCLRDGRLSGHQLPGMIKTYGDYHWLVVEGQWRHEAVSGLIVTWKGKSRGWCVTPGKMAAAELEKQLLTFEMQLGTHVRYTNTSADTVRAIASLYRWWTDKDRDAHKSHLHVHDKPTLMPISKQREAMMKWPGIGFKASKAVDDYFNGSIRQAVTAGADEWADITIKDDKGRTRRFGTLNTQKLMDFFK